MSTRPRGRYVAIRLPYPDPASLGDPSLAVWLRRGDVEPTRLPIEPCDALMAMVGMRIPASGRAALRFLGQTGDRPTVWMAAADPIYLEPRLDHLFLHAVDPESLAPRELRALVEHLQSTVASDAGIDFARVGRYTYLRADDALATAALSPAAVDQRVPNEFMPAGKPAAAYRSLISEIEMALHEHAVNTERQLRGEHPVNSLWLWGGGTLDREPANEGLPLLLSSEPVMLGYWRLHDGEVRTWPGSVNAALEQTEESLVATPRVDDYAGVEQLLAELREALTAGALEEVRFAFANGVGLRIRRWHRRRFWRRRPLSGPELTP